MEPSVTEKSLANGAGTSNLNRESQAGSAQDSDAEQKFHLPLVLTLAGAAFLNPSLYSHPRRPVNRDHPAQHRPRPAIPDERQQWIISAYYLTFGCFLLLCGRLADIFGRRSVFLLGSAWLTIVTILIPFAPNEIVVELLRGLQGLGAAANVLTAIGILGVTFQPGKHKNYAFAIYSAGSSCGLVLGNIFSGVIAQYASWKWIFWASAVLCGVVTVAGHILIPVSKVETSSLTSLVMNVDWVGGTLVTGAILPLNFALTEGNVVGWTVFWVLLLLVLSLDLLIAFAWWIWYLENKTENPPLLRFSIFHNRHFNAAQVIILEEMCGAYPSVKV